MSKQRILLVSQHYWPESFRINDAADFFIDKGCELDVLCGIPNYPSGKFFPGYGMFKNRRQVHNKANVFRVYELPRGSNTNLRVFLNYISFPFFSLFHIPRMLFRKFDKVVIYQLSPVMMALPGIILGKLKRKEITIYILDLWPENLFSVLPVQNKFLRNVAEKVSHWHYRRADKLVVNTETMKKKVANIKGIDVSKMIVSPQACEKLYEKDIKDAGLGKKFSKGFNAVFTGNISPAQSFETIIEAATILKRQGLNDINWIIVGDGMSKKWLENEVSRAGLSGSFFFEGMKPKEDIPKYTTVADALVGCLVKSDLLEATIPSKVTSYIAAGKPIVMSLDGEAQDLINNKIKCGLVSPTEDAKALAKNIKRVYQMSTKERSTMGKRGRDYHFKHLERNLVLQNLYDFIFE